MHRHLDFHEGVHPVSHGNDPGDIQSESNSEHEVFEMPREHRSPEELEHLTGLLQAELARRHLGHKKVDRRPIFQQTSVSDHKEMALRSKTVSQVVETVYDDMSIERKLFQTDVDHLVET